eukprot:CAMPEP_0118638066 /NCGR_PEP_ID=MMETSP0785-20121206/3484_1 /TAXON_ID=91992 /ORGANISM="Bolidomonas pacifica, Strain CCMP 1866" /LENGTH=441 /DNA_ID=CAMNT_0006529287 /DNA_START=471 /DNA_END=1792 /DNA_ORIENTATION=+
MALTSGWLFLHLVELIVELLALRHLITSHKILVTSIMKPVVLSYAFPISANTAFSTLSKIFSTATLIFGLELLFILLFSLIAESLFAADANFGKGLGESFITLFALSTSVNNPSCWMSLYASNKANAIFFVIFLLLTRFYVHSVVLGVIVRAYTATLRNIMTVLEAERKSALRLSFLALARGNHKSKTIPENMLYINKKDFLHTLKVVRSHYSDEKLAKLWQIVGGSDSRVYMSTYMKTITVAMGVRVRRKKGNWGFLYDWREKGILSSQLLVFDFWKVSWVCIRSLGGPIIMLLTALHIFNYVGMFSWFEQVGPWIEDEVGTEHLYYLNSFNSYLEGLVTLFNLLVVNDWHQIAKLYANQYVGSRVWSYAYFVVFQLFVSDLLVKIIIGFFVTGFLNAFGGDDKISRGNKEAFRENSFNEAANAEAAELDHLLITERQEG